MSCTRGARLGDGSPPMRSLRWKAWLPGRRWRHVSPTGTRRFVSSPREGSRRSLPRSAATRSSRSPNAMPTREPTERRMSSLRWESRTRLPWRVLSLRVAHRQFGGSQPPCSASFGLPSMPRCFAPPLATRTTRSSHGPPGGSAQSATPTPPGSWQMSPSIRNALRSCAPPRRRQSARSETPA